MSGVDRLTKLYNEQIEVSRDENGGPRSFIWRRSVYLVSSYTVEKAPVDSFVFKRYAGPDRYRCETKQGLVCDLVRQGDEWTLERVWD